MEKRTNKTSVLMVVAIVVMLAQVGCGPSTAIKTGYLSDYSRLQKISDTSMRYINKPALGRYSQFIVDDVDVHFHAGAKAIEQRTKGKLTQQQLDDLTNYFHTMIVKAVENSGNRIAYQPAAGVARIRVAITDIDRSTASSLMPAVKVVGAGIGGASMEAEIIDSKTGEQVGAVVESQIGSRIPFANLGEWDASRQVIADWAKRLQTRLEESR